MKGGLLSPEKGENNKNNKVRFYDSLKKELFKDDI